MFLFDFFWWYCFVDSVLAVLLFCGLNLLFLIVDSSNRVSLSGSINHRNLFHRRQGNVCVTDSWNWSLGLNKFPRFNERSISGELNV